MTRELAKHLLNTANSCFQDRLTYVQVASTVLQIHFFLGRPSMLVLSRKQSERIRVGDSVVVTIVRVSGDKVRIGIEAPPHIRVLRDELNEENSIDLPLPQYGRFVG